MEQLLRRSRKEGAPNISEPDNVNVEQIMKSILDPSFRYTKSVETDLHKTFAKVRRELRKQQASLAANDPVPRTVVPLRTYKV
jgi:hypothetical protein